MWKTAPADQRVSQKFISPLTIRPLRPTASEIQFAGIRFKVPISPGETHFVRRFGRRPEAMSKGSPLLMRFMSVRFKPFLYVFGASSWMEYHSF